MRVGAGGETCIPSKETTCACRRPRVGDTLAHLRQIRVYKPDEEAPPLVMGKLLKHPHSYSNSLAQFGPMLQGAYASGGLCFGGPSFNFSKSSSGVWDQLGMTVPFGWAPRAQTESCMDTVSLFRVLRIFYPMCGDNQMP